MVSIEVLNGLAFIVFLVCIISYGVILRMGMKKPTTSKRGLLNIYYRFWVLQMSELENKLEAIQTMRNLIMSVTFLSSTILILLGILAQSSANGFDELFLNFSSLNVSVLFQYKMFVLFIVLVFSLIMFLLSLRHMVRFSIIISIPVEDNIKTNDKKNSKGDDSVYSNDIKKVQSVVFLKAMNRFTFGIRGVYFATVILLWFISTYAFIVGMILITYILIKYHDIRSTGFESTPI